MDKKKIKLLMVPSDSMGVGHYRNIWPAQEIQKNHSDDFEVEINSYVTMAEIEYLKSFDIIHFHRQLGPLHEQQEQLFSELKKHGVKLIMDIDDYWEAPTTHPLYEIVKRERLSEKIIKNLINADYITTTTEVFASYIKKYNKNVFVMPNAIDLNNKMWVDEDVPKDDKKCRIIWAGGSSHLHDLKLLEKSVANIYSSKELEGKFQFVLCGFDTRGTITEIRQDGSQNVRKIHPHETVWMDFERIFTNNYADKKNDEEYFNWLNKIKREAYPNEYQKSYIRRWTLPLTQYGKHYNYGDICLAPLCEDEMIKTEKGQIIKKKHIFNEVKSELKIIESGMKKKVLIAQDFGINSKLIKHGENGFLVKDDKDWFKYIKKLILEPETRNMMAENLHKFVIDNYEIKHVTNNRCEIYKDIINKENDVIKLKEVLQKISV